MAGDGRNRRVALEHSLLGDPEVAAAPAPGDAWPLGRDERGNEILPSFRSGVRHPGCAGSAPDRAASGGR